MLKKDGIYPTKNLGGCGLFGMINRDYSLTSGDIVVKAMMNMKERGNGLGAGYAAYGIYPEFADAYAFQLMYDNNRAVEETEHILHKRFEMLESHPLPTRKVKTIKESPKMWRYFVKPRPEVMELKHETEEDFVVNTVMLINEKINGAYVMSSGKNMGAFKGVGHPDEIAEFYRVDEYRGYLWLAHTRFPTNTPGWWGGAHPFTLINWALVHNGEISSYGINKRYLEMFGYRCVLLTDTEVAAYSLDLLLRKHKLPLWVAFQALTSPFWKDIEVMKETNPKEYKLYRVLRAVYGSVMMNGPFAILFGFEKGLVGFNDRTKLRPFVAAVKGNTVYMASEGAAIREVEPKPDKEWTPRAGEPVIALFPDKDDMKESTI